MLYVLYKLGLPWEYPVFSIVNNLVKKKKKFGSVFDILIKIKPDSALACLYYKHASL